LSTKSVCLRPLRSPATWGNGASHSAVSWLFAKQVLCQLSYISAVSGLDLLECYFISFGRLNHTELGEPGASTPLEQRITEPAVRSDVGA
jgi:hypothetical protein